MPNSHMIKTFNWALIAAIIVIIWYMFTVKGQVQDLNFQLKQLNTQIDEEQKQYSILKAEIAYLESPNRLRQLAAKYLDLEPIKTAQLVSNPINNSSSNFAQYKNYNNKKLAHNSGRWRYKNRFNTVKTASARTKTF